MSARSVCNGTRPSWYPSVRAISAPPSRPAVLILIPCAPMRIALCTARFMARRNEMRCVSWCATLSPTSWASSSGRLISSTLIPTSLPVSCASSSRSLSTSAPRLPITTPGRPVWTVTVTLPGLRPMCTSALAACDSLVFRYFRIRSSSFNSSGKLRRAKERERHRVDLHVARPLENRRRPAHRRRGEALQRRPLVHGRVLRAQPVGVEGRVLALRRLLRVRHCRLQHLVDVLGGELLRVPQDGIGLRHRPAANQVHDEPHLARRLAHGPLDRSGFHQAGFCSAAAAASASRSWAEPLAEWLRNRRVAANSPSLCPTMFSVMYTGMNLFPLCTASVWPTKSGVMVERRDQVLNTFFSFLSFRAVIFTRSDGST